MHDQSCSISLPNIPWALVRRQSFFLHLIYVVQSTTTIYVELHNLLRDSRAHGYTVPPDVLVHVDVNSCSESQVSYMASSQLKCLQCTAALAFAFGQPRAQAAADFLREVIWD